MHQMKNSYIKRLRVSDHKLRQIIRLFCNDLTATQISEIVKLNRKTINNILLKVRQNIALYCEQTSPFSGEVEIDESYFGPRRIRGVRGRGAGKKIIVFGLLKRIENGKAKVYTQIVPNVTRLTLKQIIQTKIEEDSTIYSDGWRSYDGLVDWGYRKHYRVNHSNNEFVCKINCKNHINGIESFWGVAKVRLAKFRGLKQKYFNLHLKECEFRYNLPKDQMYSIILKLLRKNRDQI